MEASKMESTASIEEQREAEERKRGSSGAADPATGQGGVPEQSGANDQNRKDSDPGDAA